MLGISLTLESAESTLTYQVATCHVIVCCWSLLEVVGPLVEVVYPFLPLQYVAALIEQFYHSSHSGAAVFEHFSLSLVPTNRDTKWFTLSPIYIYACTYVHYGSKVNCSINAFMLLIHCIA